MDTKGGGRISQVPVCTVGSVCDSAGVVLRLFLLPEVCNVTKWLVSKTDRCYART